MHKLDILFFYETKLMAKQVPVECRKLNYDCYFGVNKSEKMRAWQ